MTILTFPALTPTRVTWGLKSNSETFTSPLTGGIQTSGRPGSRWHAMLEFTGMDLNQGATLDAFLASLDGMSGRFYLYPQHRPGSLAAAIVHHAGQLGRSLVVSGYAANTPVLKTGDFVSVNGELKMITAPCSTDGAGLATLQLTPALRASPAAGAAVIGTKPTTVMMLDSNDYSVTRLPGPQYDNIIVTCTEAFQ